MERNHPDVKFYEDKENPSEQTKTKVSKKKVKESQILQK